MPEPDSLLNTLLQERQRRSGVLGQPTEVAATGLAARAAGAGREDLLQKLIAAREMRTVAKRESERPFEVHPQPAEATQVQIDLPYQVEMGEIETTEDKLRDLIGRQLPGDLSQGDRLFSDDMPETIRRIGVNVLRGAPKLAIDIEESIRKDPKKAIPGLILDMPKAILEQVNEWVDASGVGLELNPDFKVSDLLSVISPAAMQGVYRGDPRRVQNIVRSVPPEQIEAARQNLVENPIGSVLMLLPFLKGGLRVGSGKLFNVATSIENATSVFGGNLKTQVGRDAANIVRKWHSDVQISYDKASRWRKQAQKGLKAQEKEDLIFYLQRTHNPFMGDRVWRRDAGYVPSPRLVFERLSPKAKRAAVGLKQRFGEIRDAVNKSGAPEELGFIKDYVTQFWRGSPEAMTKARSYFRQHNPFAKERVLESYAEGMKIPGLSPKYRDVFDILERYEQINARVVQNNALVKSFADLAAGHFDRSSLLDLARKGELEFGKVAKREAKRRVPDTPEEAAKQFGLVYDGVFEAPKKLPDGTVRIGRQYTFTDPVTKSGLNVKMISEVQSELTAHRKRFGKPPPEAPDPVADVRAEYFGEEAPPPPIRPYQVSLGKADLVTKKGSVYHGTSISGLRDILKSGRLKAQVSRGDRLGESVVSMSRYKKAADDIGQVTVELKDRAYKERPAAVKGEWQPGLEVASGKNIPISDIKKVHIEIGIDETLNWIDPITKIKLADLKKLVESKGIPVEVTKVKLRGIEGATDGQIIQYLDHLADKTGLKLNPAFSSMITTSEKAPAQYVPIKSRALARATVGYGDEVSVHPDIARPIRTVFEEPLTGPLIKTAEIVNAFSKKLALSASFFHHIALTESAVYSGVLPTSFRTGLKLLEDRAFRRDMIRSGVDISTPSDVMRGTVRGALKDLERATRDMKLAGKGAKLFRQANDVWDAALWDYYHRGLKAYVYHEKLDGMLKKYPNMSRNQMTTVKRAVATHVNNAFGGQNWDALLKSPKWRQMAHLTFLAPDWTLSNIKIATSAFKTRRAGLGGTVEGQLARRYWLRAGLVFYTASNLANYALSGHWMWENEKNRRFSIDTGNKDEKGRRNYVVASKQVREPVRWLLEPIKEATRKAAPVLQILSEQLPHGLSLSGYPTELAKRKQYGRDEVGFWEELLLRGEAIGRHALPFSLGEYNVGFAFPMRKGKSPEGSRRWIKDKVLDLYMEAKDRKRPHLINEANDLILYQALYFPDHPVVITTADIKRRIMSQVKKGIRSGK